MRNGGYFRHPAVQGDTVVFVSEDDLWTVPLEGGQARRLTSGLGDVSRPAISPDGTLLAFTGREEEHAEVFVMDVAGSAAKRVTFLGAISSVRRWTREGEILFVSDFGQPFLGRIVEPFTVSADGGIPKRMGMGPANDVSFGPIRGVVLGRNTADPARWKRYRGGTAGHLWVDTRGKGAFRRILADLDSNIGSPLWVGDRIYFVSDHEGIGNLYSCTPEGDDLRRHTDHDDFYARYPYSDGRTIVYHAGAELYRFDPGADAYEQIEVDFHSPRTQRNRRFVGPGRFLTDFMIHPKGHSIAIEARGKAFGMPLWEEAVRQYGKRDGIRYRLGQWLHDGKTFVAVSDDAGEEVLEVHRDDTASSVDRLENLDLGRPVQMRASPDKNLLALANHRQELILIDVDKKTSTVIDRSSFDRIRGFTWSPDGRWIAYGFSSSRRTAEIKLYEVATKKTHEITRAEFADVYPSWDPEGKYLYFLSYRIFDPVPDSIFFDYGFPRSVKPFLITLQKDTKPPFEKDPKGFGDEGGPKPEAKKETLAKPKGIKIDLDGIESRVLAIPVPEGRYTQVWGIKNKVLLTAYDVEGTANRNWFAPEEPKGRLEVFDFDEGKHETLVGGINYFKVADDNATLIYRANDRLRALKAGSKPEDNPKESSPDRKSGWIDLNRIRISVEPVAEWKQMLREAWRLQRDHFWVEEMSGVDWAHVYDRYLPLVDKVASRLEFSDLMWEMQGELGTSHAYELPGDVRTPPPYAMGHLGAEIEHDEKRDLYRIGHILKGDSWEDGKDSPLNVAGVRAGQTILAVGGQKVGDGVAPHHLLVNQADVSVELTVGDAAGRKPKRVVVKTLRDQYGARYREWVETNRSYVHDSTEGRVGYVHIPDMGSRGYAEFHRYYNAEVEKDGLLIDIRFNAGGHVSQLLLEKLARKRIGYSVTRWGAPNPYPEDSVLGPMVAITNELAGSDGDIFSHCFKLLDLGPLVGKRTWGGVVGISPTHRLADGSMTTQPEHSFWFKDVGWGVENYGTDPDFDVEIRPQDYVAGKDPQMEKALELMMRELKRQAPALPEFGNRPVLSLPTLPPRRRAAARKRRAAASSGERKSALGTRK
jgi:tricorn protease